VQPQSQPWPVELTAPELEGGGHVRQAEPAHQAATLRRSLEAESALQAEVQVLRERVGQLTSRLEDQRQTFVTGVQQMMQPLAEYYRQNHLEVPFAEMIPQALSTLATLSQTVAQVQAEAQTLRRPVEGRRVAPETRQVQALERLVARVADTLLTFDTRLSRLEDAGQAGQDEPQPEFLGTFVLSDQRSAEIERAVLDAQTRGTRYGS